MFEKVLDFDGGVEGQCRKFLVHSAHDTERMRWSVPEAGHMVRNVRPDEQQQYRAGRNAMGEGQPATWRLRLIKVAASVVVSGRRVVVRWGGRWPNRGSRSRAKGDSRSGESWVRRQVGKLAARRSKASPKAHRRFGPMRARMLLAT